MSKDDGAGIGLALAGIVIIGGLFAQRMGILADTEHPIRDQLLQHRTQRLGADTPRQRLIAIRNRPIELMR